MEIKLLMKRNEIRSEEKNSYDVISGARIEFGYTKLTGKKPIQYMRKRKDNVSKLQCRD